MIVPENNGLPPRFMQSIQQIKNLMNTVRQPPEQILQQLGKQDPRINQALQMCKTQNPQDIFYAMAKNMGVNPDLIINALK